MDPTKIYEDLKEKIVWLDLEPDSTLNQMEIAGSYGVSRNPLAIALTRLESEGWLVRHGSRFVVCPLTFARMREVTEIRSVLEIQANIWAMNRISSEGLAELRSLRDAILNLGPEPSKKEIVLLDFKFHRILYRETQNHELSQLLERLLSHYLRFWLAGPQEIKKDTFFMETFEIIRALEERDEIRMRAATSAHIVVSLDKILGIS